MKARVTFAYISFTQIISSHLALGPPVVLSTFAILRYQRKKFLEDLERTVARNVGHRWDVLRFDLPLAEVKFVHAIGGKKHAIKRDI